MNSMDDKSQPQDNPTGSQGHAPTKKEYRTPALTVYGDIREITRGPNVTGMVRDGATTSYTE
jgi:hypothetical protein